MIFPLFAIDDRLTDVNTGHSLGLDVHDVPSASKPAPESANLTIPEQSRKHPSFYTYLRLRLPLETGMVLVRPSVHRLFIHHSHLHL